MVLLFIPFLGWSQNQPEGVVHEQIQHYLHLFLRPDQSESVSTDAISSFITKLDEKRFNFKKEETFLRYLFTKAHQKFLKNYVDYCTFSALLEKGNYNCLTGTALYALVLDHFDMEYQIVETNYHIFLMIQTTDGRVLFEATDPINGFLDSPTEIEARIKRYREIRPVVANKICYQYKFNLCNTVSLEQLVGLMYYNLSVNAYNAKKLSASIDYLEQAINLYRTQRTDELSKIILLTLSVRSVNEAEKEICMQRLQAMPKRAVVIASNTDGY